MTEWRMSKIVRKRHGFGQIFVESELARRRAGDLRHFQRVREPRPIIIAFVLHEDLRLMLKTAERRSVNDAVAVTLIAGPGRAFGLGIKTPTACRGARRVRGALLGRRIKRPHQLAWRSLAHGLFSAFPEDYISVSVLSGNPMPADLAEPVIISARAAKRIAEILRAEPSPAMLRLAVTGGGCSGFQYNFALDDSRLDDDLVLERDGAVVLIDPVSLDFLKGAEIDFVDDLIGASFKVNNPNATSSCGCGTSFSV